MGKEDLERKIKELESKLEKLKNTDTDSHTNMVVGTSPIGFDEFDTIKQISDAKNKSEQKAGLVKTTTDGSVWDEDDVIEDKIPTSSIHVFTNIEVCECECHNRNKLDCINCYDHPVHLESKRKKPVPKEEPKKEKKPFWRR